jgi:hypothetical protein
MKTETQRYTNRYKDVYQFTRLEDGNILWEGNFEYFRVGYPNDYTEAYDAYCKNHIESFYDGPRLTLEEFKEKIYSYDSDLGKYKYPYLEKYRSLIKSDTSKLDMVDPSGGPYICVGMEWMGEIITSIESLDNGYKLIMGKK